MKIIVCIKQVPDTTDIRWTENNTIQRDGLESVINPYDLYAIEEALKINPRLKTILMSGYSAQFERHTGEEKLPFKFISKPFVLTDLLAKIQEVLKD